MLQDRILKIVNTVNTAVSTESVDSSEEKSNLPAILMLKADLQGRRGAIN
ncbi:hypothetical protein [Erwinia pyrifoliae]|nr:hypothetical protein [Erwinia pyrifoliae]MCT2388384.1 hypothetical protein [Erwinia pyrifoliae]MCU8586554.1 hypothetical protein [Erwinia pyrifoliae]